MTRMCIGASVTGALTVREVESRRARLRASDRSCALSPVRRGVCEDEVGHAAVDERGGGARQVARLQAHRAVQREPGGGDLALRAGALTAKGMARLRGATRRFESCLGSSVDRPAATRSHPPVGFRAVLLDLPHVRALVARAAIALPGPKSRPRSNLARVAASPAGFGTRRAKRDDEETTPCALRSP